MTTRLGIFGGAFNPPHFGHLRPVLEAMAPLTLEAMFFLPSGGHPLKSADMLAPVAHRLAMTRLAIQEQSGFEVCELDASREGVSYTIDTLRELQQRFPLGELIFLVGSDLLAEIHLWKEWQSIIKTAHLCALVRPGYETVVLASQAAGYFNSFRVDKPADLDRQRLGRFGFYLLPVTSLNISSTTLRQHISTGNSIRYLTPDAVVTYIQQHGLYKKYDKFYERDPGFTAKNPLGREKGIAKHG